MSKLRLFILLSLAFLALTLDVGRPAATKSASTAPVQGNPVWATKGKFEPRIDFPASTPVMIHASVLPDGRVLFWGRDKVLDGSGNMTINDEVGHSMARIWDPATGGFEIVDNITTNLFCSGHSFLPDGRLFVTGGHKHWHPNSTSGDEHTNIFDPITRTWSTGPFMQKGRWYPFNVTLDTGEVAILAGTYQDPTQPIPNPTPPATTSQKAPEIYNPTTNTLELMNESDQGLATYPYLFLDPRTGDDPTTGLPRGVFIAGPNVSYFWNPRGGANAKGAWQIMGLPNRHLDGSAVIYDSDQGKVLIVGGRSNSNTAIRQAQTITLDQANPQWQPAAQMTHPRSRHVATLLPDGKVLVTGGIPCFNGYEHTPCHVNNPALDPNTVYDVNITREAEMWNPATNQWQLMATAEKVRGYHSVAFLLPDATVLVGGYGNPDGLRVPPDAPDDYLNLRRHTTGERNVEIYKPPYLFDANGNEALRPDITSAPVQVQYGQQFSLGYGNATGISRVAWVRLPSVTHGFNQDQRINVLQYTSSGSNQLTVTAPSSSRKCPPGHYMLFVFNSAGVPSKAKIVRISNTVPPQPALSINDVTQSEGNAGTVNFTFTASLSSPAGPGGVSFNIATADGTATAASGDYVAKSLTTQTIPQGNSTYQFTVQVNGDTAVELNETFVVNVSNLTGATPGDIQGQGTITNDDTSGRTNFALTANGGVATASSTYSANYPASATNNGDRKGLGWGQSTGGWSDGTQGTYSSDVAQVNFDGFKYLSEVDVYTLRDNYHRTDEPTLDEIFNTANDSGQGITHFEVQYWNGSVWVTVPGGLVDNNNKVWRRFQFPEVVASAVRVQVHGTVKWLNAGNNFSRLVELEAWGRDYGTQHTVWSDDATPPGATLWGDGESWNWVSSNPTPVSGSTSHQSALVSGMHQHYFYNTSQTISVGAGESMFAYVYLDPANPPSQVMLQWFENGSWEHRAYWGANQLPWGVDGTNSRRNMGPLPPTGQWVRLEVPASQVGLEGRVVNGMAFSLFNGRATWDYAGRSIPVLQTVWLDDALPAGATPAGIWKWVSSNPNPFSGAVSHQSNIVSGIHQHYYTGGDAMLLMPGERLIAYVYLDPVNPPSEVMLQWFESGSWEHRAYWGQNLIPWGVDGSDSRRYMGPLPPAGQWVRLEVPSNQVGLNGWYFLNGIAFSLYNGRATWDYAGKASSLIPTSRVNLARQAGSTASASSQFSAAYPVSAIIDGDHLGNNWGLGGYGSGWNDATQGEFSQDWLQVTFSSVKTIDEIDVITLQDNFASPLEPTLSMLFSTADNVGQGITDYEVQYRNPSTGKWVTIPNVNAHVTGNDKVWRQFTFAAVSTNAIRVVVHGAARWTTIPNNYSRIVEVEAWGG